MPPQNPDAAPDTAPEVTQLTTRQAYRNPWLRVREDTIRRQDGSEGLYGVIERADFAIIVPWQNGCITLVEQFRYPVGRRLWELPMGTIEDSAASPQHIAATELRQETGLIAGQMRFVASLYQAPGFCDQTGHVFLATDLTQGPPEREISEQGMRSHAFPLSDVMAMIQAGTLQDGMTLAAIGLLVLRGLLPPA